MQGDDGERAARIPARPGASADPRALAAWTAWLHALASDAEAAFAAAVAYESLDEASRASWLDALDEDAPTLSVPKIAVYAPLLSVERDPARLARIHAALGDDVLSLGPPAESRSLRGVHADGSRVVVLVLPLYLSFVQVFSCRFSPSEGFAWARHDPFARDDDSPCAGAEHDGAMLERTPMKPVIEELAHAVLAQRRRGLDPPEELRAIIDLFSPVLGEG
jgi:hypothetical protein